MKRLTLAVFAFGMLVTGALVAADQTGAEKNKRPVSAEVIGTAKAENADKIGDIEVTYADGSKDRWTTKGNAGLPQVAADGSVGWTVYSPETKVAASYKMRPNCTLVVSRQGKVLCRVRSIMAFIEEWSFLEDGAKFALKTRGAHGPASVELHETKSGKLLQTVGAGDEKLPKWAEAFRE